jgi:hypothetical protein
VSDARLAHEDRLQSRAAPLPSLGVSSQYRSLRRAVGLAAEGLRLNIARYQTDEAVSLEVVEARNS